MTNESNPKSQCLPNGDAQEELHRDPVRGTNPNWSLTNWSLGFERGFLDTL